jgi:CheY-like chemotaxis protein
VRQCAGPALPLEELRRLRTGARVESEFRVFRPASELTVLCTRTGVEGEHEVSLTLPAAPRTAIFEQPLESLIPLSAPASKLSEQLRKVRRSIFCDVMMSEMSGVEVYRRIRERGRGEERQLVFTGSSVRALVAMIAQPRWAA